MYRSSLPAFSAEPEMDNQLQQVHNVVNQISSGLDIKLIIENHTICFVPINCQVATMLVSKCICSGNGSLVAVAKLKARTRQ